MSDMLHKERVRAGKYEVDIQRSVDADGKKVILMIHGIGVSGAYFIPFARLLTDNYDVRIIDLPGYGTTPRPATPLSPAELAEVAADYLKTCGVSGAVVVGQSMGCQTAAHLALRYSELCERLVLVGPTVNRNERTLPFQAFRLLQDSFLEPMSVNKIILRDYMRMGPGRFLKTAVFMVNDRLEDTLQGVTVPICIIRGSRDYIVPRAWVNYLRKVSKRVEIREVEGGPHNIQYAKPKELVATCKDFLKS